MVVSGFRLRSDFPQVNSTSTYDRYAEKASQTFLLRLRQVKAIEVHHLVPRGYKVMDELPLGISTAVDFCQGAELRV